MAVRKCNKKVLPVTFEMERKLYNRILACAERNGWSLDYCLNEATSNGLDALEDTDPLPVPIAVCLDALNPNLPTKLLLLNGSSA